MRGSDLNIENLKNLPAFKDSVISDLSKILGMRTFAVSICERNFACDSKI